MKFITGLFIISLLFLLCNCKKSNVDTAPQQQPQSTDTTTLKNVSSFKIGAAIDVSLLQNNSAYRSVLLQQHSSITTENTLNGLRYIPNKIHLIFPVVTILLHFVQQIINASMAIALSGTKAIPHG